MRSTRSRSGLSRAPDLPLSDNDDDTEDDMPLLLQEDSDSASDEDSGEDWLDEDDDDSDGLLPAELEAESKPAKAGTMQTSMDSFVSVVKAAGRPKKRRGRAGAGRKEKPRAAKTKEEPFAEAKAAIASRQKAKVKRRRVSLTPGSPEHDMLVLAVEGWFDKGGAKDRGVSKAECVREWVKDGLAKTTVEKHLHPDVNKRRRLEKNPRGRKPLLPRSQQRVIADALASADLGNEGVSSRVAVQTTLQLAPKLKHEQARGHHAKTLRANHADTLCGKPVKAQTTTSMRTMVTRRGMIRWHAHLDCMGQHLMTVSPSPPPAKSEPALRAP